MDAPDDTLEIRLPKPRISWPSRILSLLVVSLLIYLATQVLRIFLSHRPIFDWWNSNDGPRYHNYFSLFLLLGQFEGSGLLNWLLAITRPPNSLLNKSQVIFITKNLFPFLLLPNPLDPTTQIGILTPKQLCKTVLLHGDDGDKLFNDWLKKASPPRKQGATALEDKYYLTFTPFGDEDHSNSRDYSTRAIPLDPPNSTAFGVYPRPDDRESWMGCFQAWANGGLKKPAKFIWYRDADNSKVWALQPSAGQNLQDDDLDLWYNQPDNFLGRYAILMNSPLVVFYITGLAYLKGQYVSLDANALTDMLGQNSDLDPGGWLGMLQGRGDQVSADDIYNFLHTSIDFARMPPDPPTKCKGPWWSMGSAALSTVPMLTPFMELGPVLGSIGAAVSAAFVLGASLLGGFFSYKGGACG